MKKTITFFSLLCAGAFVGWHSHSVFVYFSAEPVIALEPAEENSPVPAIETRSSEFNAPGFFSSKNLMNNTQLGMVIELIKQDLDTDTQTKLNKDVVQYARSLLSNAGTGDNTEQRLLALLGNFDTKEQVLDILARFYERSKQYEQAISSLYNLREMIRFDEDYKKISSRISVLSQKNLKHLKARNYNTEMGDFFEFMIAKEPDNFSIQMQYAEFEYKNRNYGHVDQLLSVLVFHPEYALKSESLLQKARHQKEMIENGIVPVPVEKSGDHYIVNAVINGQESVKLIIDTGATLTILSPKVIQDLGLNFDDAQQFMEFSTANGVVKAPLMSLESVKIQNHLVTDLQVGVLSTFSSSEFGGLLGMNFLNQFAFFIDQKNSTLELVENE